MPQAQGIWELISHAQCLISSAIAIAQPWINSAIAIIALWHTVRRSGKNAKWEEYEETVYEPIMNELHNLENVAKSCRRKEVVSGDEDEAAAFLQELSELLNDLVSVCDKASSHDATIFDDWPDFAERQAQSVHDFIGSAESSAVIPEGLSKKLLDCSQEFHGRLREQRMRMAGSWSPRSIFRKCKASIAAICSLPVSRKTRPPDSQ